MDIILCFFGILCKSYDSDEIYEGGVMLILTRRAGESLMIGEDVSITVLGVKGNQVRIGIDAPKEVAVHREEIYDRIQGDDDQEIE